MRTKFSIFLIFMLVALLILPACAKTPFGASNIKYDPGTKLSVVVTDPTSPESGDPVRYGYATGIAETDEGEGGNASTYTTVNFGNFVATCNVTDTSGGVAVGDTLFYDDSLDGISDNSSYYFFGIAMGTVTAGSSANIDVLHVQSPGSSGTLGAGTVGTTNLAADAVTGAKILDGTIIAEDIASSAVTLVKINPNSIDGTIAKDVASGDAIGGISLLHMITVPTGATNAIDTTFTYKEQIIDAWFIKGTTASDSAASALQLCNGTDNATWLSDNMSLNNKGAGAIVRAANIYTDNATILAGGKLRIFRATVSGDVACTVYVKTIRVP